MSSRRLPSEMKNSTGKRPYVKVTSKKDFIKALLNLFPQQTGRPSASKGPQGWPQGSKIMGGKKAHETVSPEWGQRPNGRGQRTKPNPRTRKNKKRRLEPNP